MNLLHTISLTGLLSRASQQGGSVKSVIDETYQLSWSEFEHRVDHTARYLAQKKIGEGDKVAVLMTNSVRLLEVIFAIIRCGGIYVPVNYRFADQEIVDCLNDCEANSFILEPSFKPILKSLSKTNLQTIIFCSQTDDDMQGVDGANDNDLSLLAKRMDDRGRCGDDLAAIFYTSGTTGRPKGVTLTHGGIVINTLQWISALSLSRNDCLMIVAPMFHAAGALNAIGAAALGARVYFMGSFDLGKMLEAIQTHKITKIGLIVVMLDMIGRHPDLDQYDLSSVLKISYGGSPITENALARAREIFPNAEFYQVYGQTEAGPTVSVLPSEYHVAGTDQIRSAGFPVIGTEIMIIDEDGHELPQGQVGEICVKGPGITPGYWKLEAKTNKSRHGDYFKSGDAGYLDGEGLLYVCARVKDMIISGGENVYPSEVENALMKFDGMVECAVIGIPSDKWGEKVHAIVRLKPEISQDEAAILSHCRQWIGGYKIPRSVEFWTEALPVSSSAKILKTVLREPYWKNRDGEI